MHYVRRLSVCIAAVGVSFFVAHIKFFLTFVSFSLYQKKPKNEWSFLVGKQKKLRAIYMVLMMAMRDEETQKRGVVGIPYNVGRDHTKDREAVWKAAKLVSILPVRFTGIHYCFSDEKVQLLFSLAMFVFNKNARIRCRLHMGTHMECIYKLVS